MIEGTILSSHAASDGADVVAKSGGCPECGARLIHRDGCVACVACGYSKCG